MPLESDLPPGFAPDPPDLVTAPEAPVASVDLGVTEKVPAGRAAAPLAWRRPPAGAVGQVDVSDLPPGFEADADPAPTTATLRASYDAVRAVNPDEHGKVLRIARETGAPPDVVAADPEGLARTVPPPGLDMLPSHAPVVAAFVADPRNMAAAKDDIDQLTWLERWVTGGFAWGRAGEGFHFEPNMLVRAWHKGSAQILLDLAKTGEKLGISSVGAPSDPQERAQQEERLWAQEEALRAAAAAPTPAAGAARYVTAPVEAAPFIGLVRQVKPGEGGRHVADRNLQWIPAGRSLPDKG